MRLLEIELSFLPGLVDDQTPNLIMQAHRWEDFEGLAFLYGVDTTSIKHPAKCLEGHILDHAKLKLRKAKFQAFKRAWTLADRSQQSMLASSAVSHSRSRL